MKNVTTIREYFVYHRNSGGEYLTNRSRRKDKKYRWVKNKRSVTLLSYDAAQKARLRYGGEIIRVDTIIREKSVY